MKKQNILTASKLIKNLQKLPPDTIVMAVLRVGTEGEFISYGIVGAGPLPSSDGVEDLYVLEICRDCE